MRFSALFQHPLPQPCVAPLEPAGEEALPAALPGQDLPEDLDARVRLLGEWQLFEG
jgi:hypothetical protein